jgi:hypothetical protein
MHVNAARSDGWYVTVASNRKDPLAFGSKVLSTGDATLFVSSYRDRGRFLVSIRLEHRMCPTNLCA